MRLLRHVSWPLSDFHDAVRLGIMGSEAQVLQTLYEGLGGPVVVDASSFRCKVFESNTDAI
eukprot:4374869-Amphidinium_carterae.1